MLNEVEATSYFFFFFLCEHVKKIFFFFFYVNMSKKRYIYKSSCVCIKPQKIYIFHTLSFHSIFTFELHRQSE
jgi:hypothetical protein